MNEELMPQPCGQDVTCCELEQPLRKQLTNKKTELERELKMVNAALDILNNNPAIAQVLETVRQGIRL